MPEAARAASYLAFDLGLKRIGVAVGDTVTGLARPLPTVHCGNGVDWRALDKLVADWRPAGLIVGLPLMDDGSDQAMTTHARRFAVQLGERCKIPVHLADERFSSRAADDALRDARSSGQMTRRVKKGDRDGQAARVVLEQWLASQAGDRSSGL